MIPESVVLHGGLAPETTLLDYLFRIVLHLFAFGGTAVVVSRGLGAVIAVHSRVLENGGDEEGDL